VAVAALSTPGDRRVLSDHTRSPAVAADRIRAGSRVYEREAPLDEGWNLTKEVLRRVPMTSCDSTPSRFSNSS
jgi:hypothetical protein